MTTLTRGWGLRALAGAQIGPTSLFLARFPLRGPLAVGPAIGVVHD